MVRSAEEAENRRLQAKTMKIEREKARQLVKIETEHLREVDAVQNKIRLNAVMIPPLPALFMGIVIFASKRRRERTSIPQSRKRGAA